jgi:hypothetical protein
MAAIICTQRPLGRSLADSIERPEVLISNCAFISKHPFQSDRLLIRHICFAATRPSNGLPILLFPCSASFESKRTNNDLIGASSFQCRHYRRSLSPKLVRFTVSIVSLNNVCSNRFLCARINHDDRDLKIGRHSCTVASGPLTNVATSGLRPSITRHKSIRSLSNILFSDPRTIPLPFEAFQSSVRSHSKR